MRAVKDGLVAPWESHCRGVGYLMDFEVDLVGSSLDYRVVLG